MDTTVDYVWNYTRQFLASCKFNARKIFDSETFKATWAGHSDEIQGIFKSKDRERPGGPRDPIVKYFNILIGKICEQILFDFAKYLDDTRRSFDTYFVGPDGNLYYVEVKSTTKSDSSIDNYRKALRKHAKKLTKGGCHTAIVFSYQWPKGMSLSQFKSQKEVEEFLSKINLELYTAERIADYK
jgi:hypothetical protein